MSDSDSELTPLMVAARSGDLVSIERLLAAGAVTDVEREATPFKAPFTALYQAVLNHRRDAAILLASADMSSEQIKRHILLLFNLHRAYHPGPFGPRMPAAPARVSSENFKVSSLAEDISIRLLLTLQKQADSGQEFQRYLCRWLNHAATAGLHRFVIHGLQALGTSSREYTQSLATCMWCLVESSAQHLSNEDASCHSAVCLLLSLLPPRAGRYFKNANNGIDICRPGIEVLV